MMSTYVAQEHARAEFDGQYSIGPGERVEQKALLGSRRRRTLDLGDEQQPALIRDLGILDDEEIEESAGHDALCQKGFEQSCLSEAELNFKAAIEKVLACENVTQLGHFCARGFQLLAQKHSARECWRARQTCKACAIGLQENVWSKRRRRFREEIFERVAWVTNPHVCSLVAKPAAQSCLMFSLKAFNGCSSQCAESTYVQATFLAFSNALGVLCNVDAATLSPVQSKSVHLFGAFNLQ